MKEVGYCLIPFEEFRYQINQILSAVGLGKEEASLVSDVICDAQASDMTTHGLQIFKNLLIKIMSEGSKDSRYPKIIMDQESFCIFDAKFGLGYLAASYGMKLAVEKAKIKGIYTVFIRRSHTFGPGYFYAKMAAESDCIGIITGNSPANMAFENSLSKLLGTNPLAIGVPVAQNPPLLFDMSTSVAAKSKLIPYLESGNDIPGDWAVDEMGNKTTDPKKAMNGVMLPAMGYKGLGLSMMIDILAGLLSGSGYLDGVGRAGGSMNAGSFITAIYPAHIYGNGFKELMKDYVDHIRNSRPDASGLPIHIPGDSKHEAMRISMVQGVKVTKKHMDEINSFLEERDISLRLVI